MKISTLCIAVTAALFPIAEAASNSGSGHSSGKHMRRNAAAAPGPAPKQQQKKIITVKGQKYEYITKRSTASEVITYIAGGGGAALAFMKGGAVIYNRHWSPEVKVTVAGLLAAAYNKCVTFLKMPQKKKTPQQMQATLEEGATELGEVMGVVQDGLSAGGALAGGA